MRLPVNTNSTHTLSAFKSHLEHILFFCYDVQGKNKTGEKTKPKTKQKQDGFRDRKTQVQKVEHKNI